ncbi:MAG: MFS transporter [Candidatus Margulisiibacteriota bacterium]|jgi:MFS family permease
MNLQKAINLTVIVAALGYFVDIYDLILFSIIRVASLTSLGYSGPDLLSKGVFLLNMQMAGMLLGGIIWGLLGDKKGRISVLFGSILIYSIANLLNAFVTSFEQYAMIRFIAGIGLAGELGVGITLVAESLPAAYRGYGTTIVASVGILGAICAALVGNILDWRMAFIIGGIMGFCLLVLRISVSESLMFKTVAKSGIKRGNFLLIFTSAERFWKYAKCILIGAPIWFIVGIFVTFSPEFARAMGVTEPITAGTSIMACYFGLFLGDLTSGFTSQILKSRNKIVLVFLLLCTLSGSIYLFIPHASAGLIYLNCLFLGFSAGYWAVMVTIAAEQFGTDIRATVATTVPNFVRGSLVLFTSLFLFLKVRLDIIPAAALVGLLTLVLAFIGLYGLKESYSNELDFVEMS